jgi:hypothetical protein
VFVNDPRYRVDNQQPVQGQPIGDHNTNTITIYNHRWGALLSIIVVVIVLLGLFLLLFHTVLFSGQPTGEGTPTATLSTSTDPYTHQGHLVLNDSLASNNQNEWNIVDQVIGGTPISSCEFAGQHYQVLLQPQATYQTSYCWNHTLLLQNFVYQVMMNLVTNTGGGIIFRLDKNTGHFFYFGINPYGQYTLAEAKGNSFTYWKQDVGTSAIHPGLGQKNTLAIVAEGDQVSMYINGQSMTPASININNNDTGYIGMAVDNDITKGTSGQANFTDAEVWSLDE